MIKLSTVLQEPIEVEIDGKVLKFSYLTLGDYKIVDDLVEIALASLKKLQPQTTRAFVEKLPLDSEELIGVLMEVAALKRTKGSGDSKNELKATAAAK